MGASGLLAKSIGWMDSEANEGVLARMIPSCQGAQVQQKSERRAWTEAKCRLL